MQRFLASSILTCVAAGSAAAQPSFPPARARPGEVSLPVVRLTLTANDAPTPALKYALLPELGDLKPGNAALLYQRAHAPDYWQEIQRRPDWSKLGDFLDMPLAKMPVERVHNVLNFSALKEIDRAARRDYCDWDFTQRLRDEGLTMLIPDIQAFRSYGQILALRARLELVRGELGPSHYTLQTALALSRHLSDSPFMISSLVAKGIADQALAQVEEWIQQPKAPSLYWSLADLPRPFFDARRPLQGEKVMVDSVFPEARRAVRDVHAPVPTIAQAQAGLDALAPFLGGDPTRPMRAVWAARAYPLARQWLIDQGRPEKEVDTIPVTVAWVLYNVAMKNKHYEDMIKWANVPYWEARPYLQKIMKRQQESRLTQPEVTFIAWHFMPATEVFLFARVRLDRRIAMLQTVEALRLHAHQQGALPMKLADVDVVPLPRDPVTGNVFQYRLDKDGVALLTGPPPAGQNADAHNSLRYELTLRKR